jgi:hypothetical protein
MKHFLWGCGLAHYIGGLLLLSTHPALIVAAPLFFIGSALWDKK